MIQSIVRNIQNEEISIKLEAERSNNCYSIDQPGSGQALWFAAENMCGLIDNLRQEGGSPQSLLELGAGPGLAGIYAARVLGNSLQTVVLTDGDADVVQLLQRNISRNAVDRSPSSHDYVCSAEVLLWGMEDCNQSLLSRHSLPEGFDVILGADLIYGKVSTATITLLFQTVHQLLSQTGAFYLAFTRRNLSISIVLDEASKLGFDWTLEPDFIYDIFENNVEGLTDLWRDVIYSFRKSKRIINNDNSHPETLSESLHDDGL
jgi:SAM-dependent methyltransferase